MDEILTDVHDRAAVLAKGTKLLSAILPKCRRLHSVADVADFTAPFSVNPDFSRLSKNTVSLFRPSGWVPFHSLR